MEARMKPRGHAQAHAALLLLVALACSGDPAQTVGPGALSTSRSEVNASSNPRIIPPNANYRGLTYGEWQTRFHQWLFSIPAADNPVLLGNEDKLATGQPDHLWFLGNSAPVVDRHFTVPTGTALYANIFTVEADNLLCLEPDTQLTLDELRALASSIVDLLTDIQVEVDGRPVENVTQYRAISPVFSVTLPAENFLRSVGCTDALAGTYAPLVSEGYAIILPPLPVGEHTIHETGVVVVDPSDPSLNVRVDIMWRITVVPRGRTSTGAPAQMTGLGALSRRDSEAARNRPNPHVSAHTRALGKPHALWPGRWLF
jgi:hypothetical protein